MRIRNFNFFLANTFFLFLAFFAQTSHIFAVSSVVPNLIVIVFPIFLFLKQVPLWVPRVALLTFTGFIFLFFRFWLIESIVFFVIALGASVFVKFFTGTRFFDYLITVASTSFLFILFLDLAKNIIQLNVPFSEFQFHTFQFFAMEFFINMAIGAIVGVVVFKTRK